MAASGSRQSVSAFANNPAETSNWSTLFEIPLKGAQAFQFDYDFEAERAGGLQVLKESFFLHLQSHNLIPSEVLASTSL